MRARDGPVFRVYRGHRSDFAIEAVEGRLLRLRIQREVTAPPLTAAPPEQLADPVDEELSAGAGNTGVLGLLDSGGAVTME